MDQMHFWGTRSSCPMSIASSEALTLLYFTLPHGFCGVLTVPIKSSWTLWGLHPKSIDSMKGPWNYDRFWWNLPFSSSVTCNSVIVSTLFLAHFIFGYAEGVIDQEQQWMVRFLDQASFAWVNSLHILLLSTNLGQDNFQHLFLCFKFFL